MAVGDPIGRLLTVGHRENLGPGQALKIWRASKKVYTPGMSADDLTTALKGQLGAGAFDWAAILQLIQAIITLLNQLFPPKAAKAPKAASAVKAAPPAAAKKKKTK